MGWEDWLAHVQAIPSGTAGGIYDKNSGYPNAEFGAAEYLPAPDTVLKLVQMVNNSSCDSVQLGSDKSKKVMFIKREDNCLSFKFKSTSLVAALSDKCLVCCVIDDANSGPRNVTPGVCNVVKMLIDVNS